MKKEFTPIAMKCNQPKEESFEEITQPIIEWLKNNQHPHTMIEIDTEKAILWEGKKTNVPSVFVEEKNELVVGKYYKHPEYPKFLTCLREDKTRFGFDVYGTWFENGDIIKDEHQKAYFEATEQEVFEALKNEAVKRGFKDSIYINRPFYKDDVLYLHPDNLFNNQQFQLHENKTLMYGGWNIFKDGVWAEILPTLTIPEAEQRLKELGVNAKIV